MPRERGKRLSGLNFSLDSLEPLIQIPAGLTHPFILLRWINCLSLPSTLPRGGFFEETLKREELAVSMAIVVQTSKVASNLENLS